MLDSNNYVGTDTNYNRTILEFDKYDPVDLTNIFVVDWEYLTFHSPEFEFNDSFYNIDTTTLRCRITGTQILSYNQGDLHIITSSSPISTDASGFYHRAILTENSACRINAGLFYKDGRVVKKDDNLGADHPYEAYVADGATHDKLNYFLVYPWHRTGSLNNDCIRPEQAGSRTAVLNQKKIINIMYFGELVTNISEDLYNSNVKIFNSD